MKAASATSPPVFVPLAILFSMMLWMFFLAALGRDAAASDAVLAYRSNTGACASNALNCPKVRVWSSAGNGSWGSEIILATAGSPIRYAVVKHSPVAEKAVLVTLSDDGFLDAYACAANCSNLSSWTTTNNIGQVWSTAASQRRFDVEFETATGDAIVAYGVLSSNGAQDIGYKVLPAANISFAGIAEQFIDDPGHGGDIQYTWIALDRNPTSGSSELIGIAFDSSNSDVNAAVWSGSTWGNLVEVAPGSTAASGGENLAVRYAADGSLGMVLAGDGTGGNVAALHWNGTAWANTPDFDVDSSDALDVRWLSLEADPASDDLQAIGVDSGSDLFAAYWSGTTWAVTSNIDTSVDSNTARPADFAWNPFGSAGRLVWDTDTTGTTLSQRPCAPQCTGSTTTISVYAGTGAWLSLLSNPTASDAVDILGIRLQSTFDIGALGWDGGAYTNYGDTAITADTAAATFEAYSLAFGLFAAAPADTRAPNWSNPQANASPVYQNMLVQFNASWGDDVGLSGHVFSINQSGAWVNGSHTPFSGTANTSVNATLITAMAGTTVAWRFFSNDTSNTYNQTDIQSFVVAYPSLGANASLTGASAVPAGNSTVLSGNCSCLPAGQACGAAFIVLQDNRTGAFTNSTGDPLAAVSSNVTGYSLGSLSGTSANFFFNITGRTAGAYQFRVHCNASGTNGTLAESSAIPLTVSVETGRLGAELASPLGASSQPQNQTFLLAANLSCAGSASATCGIVNGTLRYNATSAAPHAAVQGFNVAATPFYAVEANPQGCGLLNGSSPPCTLAWTVNATGAIGSSHALDVNATSDTPGIGTNATPDAAIAIIAPTLSITISSALADVQFGSALSPGSANNSALANNQSAYTIMCAYAPGSCHVSIQGSNQLISGSNAMGIGNVSWNQANTLANKKALAAGSAVINATLGNLATQPIYFWIDIPEGQPAGNYRSNFTIQGQPS